MNLESVTAHFRYEESVVDDVGNDYLQVKTSTYLNENDYIDPVSE